MPRLTVRSVLIASAIVVVIVLVARGAGHWLIDGLVALHGGHAPHGGGR
jgi:hypothetical protein